MPLNTLDKTITEARNHQLQEKLRYHLVKAALAVMAEKDTTENHTNRISYAKIILKGGANIHQVALALTANATIAAKIHAGESYDDDIAFVVTTIFNAFANAEN